MIDPHGDAIIKRVALFLFLVGAIISLVAYRAASAFRVPDQQGVEW